MNYREYAKFLIDQIPESKLPYVAAFLMGVAIPDSFDGAYYEQPAQKVGVSTNKGK